MIRGLGLGYFSPRVAYRAAQGGAQPGDGGRGVREGLDGLRGNGHRTEGDLERLQTGEPGPGTLQDLVQSALGYLVGEAEALHREMEPPVENRTESGEAGQDAAVRVDEQEEHAPRRLRVRDRDRWSAAPPFDERAVQCDLVGIQAVVAQQVEELGHMVGATQVSSVDAYPAPRPRRRAGRR